MLTQERLKEVLEYDPASGNFIWKKRISIRCSVGEIAGKLGPQGYVLIGIDKKQYRAHRLVWLYFFAKFPTEDLDHINGNRADNRLNNLREVSRSVNNQNQRSGKSNNKTGYLGVSIHSKSPKFVATIKLNNKTKYLGLFKTPEEAYEVYLKAKRELHEGNML
jgi:hypothetical protein